MISGAGANRIYPPGCVQEFYVFLPFPDPIQEVKIEQWTFFLQRKKVDLNIRPETIPLRPKRAFFWQFLLRIKNYYFPFVGPSPANGSTSGITLTPVVNLNGAISNPLGKVISTI